MYHNTWTPSPLQPSTPPRPTYRGWRWLRTLVIGVVLFLIAATILLWSGNPNLLPTVILLGNFLVPVVFVAFLYDHQHNRSLFGWLGGALPALRPSKRICS